MMDTSAPFGHGRKLLPSMRGLVLGAAAGLFLFFCVLPAAYMLAQSVFGADGRFTLGYYHGMLGDPRQRQLLLQSSALSGGTALISTLIGVPLGLLLARTDLPAKHIFRLAFLIPAVIPPYILALAWTYLGGSAGVVAHILGRDLLSTWTYSLAGAIVVLGVAFFPLSMLATEAAALRVESKLEEAAAMVARPGRVLWRITIPLMAPSIAAAAVLIFMLALSEFGVPGLLRVPVFTTEIFTAFAARYDFGAGTSLSVPLIAIALLAGITARLAAGNRLLATGRAVRVGLRCLLGRWRAPAVIGLMVALFMFVALPVGVLAIEAGHFGRIKSAVGASMTAIVNSLVLSAVSSTIIVILAALLGYGRARMKLRAGLFADLVFVAIFALPGTVVGVSLIGLWNRPGLPGAIYTSSGIIVVACLARFLPVAALMLAAGVRQIPASLEEAAQVAGAGWLKVFSGIVTPQIWTTILAAWVVSFILCFGELGATVLVAPVGESTLPIRIYTLIANAPSANVAALALMQAGILMAPLAAVGMFSFGPRKG